jgi:hypothetical protein
MKNELNEIFAKEKGKTRECGKRRMNAYKLHLMMWVDDESAVCCLTSIIAKKRARMHF